jgi:hypothetical protein
MKNYWFQCQKEECDNRPFKITQDDLNTGEGQVNCEICDSVCVDITKQYLTKPISVEQKVANFRKTKVGKLASRYYELGATPIQAAKFAYAISKKGKTFGMRRNIVGACPHTNDMLTEVIVK